MTTPVIRSSIFRRICVASKKASTLLSRYQQAGEHPLWNSDPVRLIRAAVQSLPALGSCNPINADRREPNGEVGAVEGRTPPRDVGRIVFFSIGEVKEIDSTCQSLLESLSLTY
ncbi:MAG: hypothetical protein DMG88_18865 [Acidobacteria bacterium]|nr:MAG: hypothetical protein DMG88_18865 [Acidobacteriota bacterium]